MQHQVSDALGSTCPSCGRFVGPLEKCPHCGAKVGKRLPLRYLKLGSLLLALAGIIALLYAASGAATPRVSISSIETTMNYAYVRLEGQVTRGPSYNPDSQELRFYLSDATGEIPVSSFRATTRQLIDQKKIPVAGDHAVVEGMLRVREDLVSLNLASPDKLALSHPAARAVKIGELGRDQNLQRVTIEGDVREVRTPYKGLTLISVGDATGEIDTAIYSDITALTGNLPELQVGDSVQVTGTVTLFKDTPQLVLTNGHDLVRAEAVSAAVTTSRIGELDAARLNSRVSVAGQVTSVNKFSQGLRAVLDDGSGSITLVLWNDTLAQIANPAELKKGARVQVVGKLNQYRGELEIVPVRASDVQIVTVTTAMNNTPGVSVTPASGASPDARKTSASGETATAARTSATDSTSIPTPAATTRQPSRTPAPGAVQRTIGSLTTADENRLVVVSGRITSATSFSKGMRYKLDDGTGTLTLLLWSDVLSSVKNSDALIEGARVQATGTISIFTKALELAPAKGSDVIVLALSTVPTPSIRPIASLTADDAGTTIIMTGTVKQVSDFSKGKYLTVDDKSGQIRVTVFSDVLAAVPHKEKLQPGAGVIIRAKVNLYRGSLELVPERGGITIE